MSQPLHCLPHSDVVHMAANRQRADQHIVWRKARLKHGCHLCWQIRFKRIGIYKYIIWIERLAILIASINAIGKIKVDGFRAHNGRGAFILGAAHAHGLLGAYLIANKLLPHDQQSARFTGAQGHYLKRAGHVDIELALVGGKLAGVRIIGQAEIVFETILTL